MRVWLQVWRMAIKPTSTPMCLGSSVNSLRVSDAALKRILYRAFWFLRARGLMLLGRVKTE